jgi:hypothetical protein
MPLDVHAILSSLWRNATAANAAVQLLAKAKDCHAKHRKSTTRFISVIALGMVFASGFWFARRSIPSPRPSSASQVAGPALQQIKPPPSAATSAPAASTGPMPRKHRPHKDILAEKQAKPPVPGVGLTLGTDATAVGNLPTGSRLGDGSTYVGATDANGNTILNRGGTAIGHGATADPTSIAIAANAHAGGTPPATGP